MDVIVIGCGASGVAALTRLHKAGLKAIGLEAENRIGGRIHAVEFGGATVDIGCSWCERDNEVFELTKPHDVVTAAPPSTTWYVRSDGEVLPNEQGDEITAAMNEEVENADYTGTGSMLDSVRNALNTNSTLQKDPKLSKSFVEWFERNSHAGGQNDPREGKSLKGLLEFQESDGTMLEFVGRSCEMIIDLLLNKYPDPSKALPVEILLNKAVESIKWVSDSSRPLVQVKCKDGSSYEAKGVIITASVEVLKQSHADMFNPPLPAEKVNTINNLHNAVLEKIYIEFTEPWWPKLAANFNILWQDEDKAKFSEDEKWVTEIHGLQSLTGRPNLAVAWIYGNGAKEMVKVSLEQLKAGVQKLLDTMFTKFNVSPVKNVTRSTWASNPYQRGAYSYRSVATEQNGASAVILSEPLIHNSFPVVCFGGEATSHKRHGAVDGAVEAGYREADRLIESIKKLQQK